MSAVFHCFHSIMFFCNANPNSGKIHCGHNETQWTQWAVRNIAHCHKDSAIHEYITSESRLIKNLVIFLLIVVHTVIFICSCLFTKWQHYFAEVVAFINVVQSWRAVECRVLCQAWRHHALRAISCIIFSIHLIRLQCVSNRCFIQALSMSRRSRFHNIRSFHTATVLQYTPVSYFNWVA